MTVVILPRFWSEYPMLWFTHAEAVFSMQAVTAEEEMYNHLLIHLDKETFVLVKDVVRENYETEAHKDDKYSYTKREILKRISLNNMRKIKFGTQKPSKYYEQLKIKADSVPLINIQDMWLRNLPSQVSDILILAASQDMDLLCRLADKLIEVLPKYGKNSPDISVCENEDDIKVFKNVKQELDNLKQQFGTLEESFGESKKSLLECSKIINDVLNINDSDNNKKTICWYHSIYADKAHSCIAPCDYKS